MYEDDAYARDEARRNWDRARRRLWLGKLLRPFRGDSDELIPFERVQKELRLVQGHSRGVQQIPIDCIRGSVGRYRDFTASFLPRKRKLRDRWQQVDVVSATRGFPPISVYKVGEAYFVLDGNHRVSVARQAGANTIEAHVLDYAGPVGLSARADLDEVLLKAEEADFRVSTGIDRIRPRHGIVFTAPGRYRQVKYLIKVYRRDLARDRRRPVQWAEAAARWVDHVFGPKIRDIEASGVLDKFPDRTAADLFVWMWKHNRTLDDLRRVDDVNESPSAGFWQRFRRALRAALPFRWFPG